MKDLLSYLVDEMASIYDAMALLSEGARGILFVTDKESILIGTLTDGDIRRHILKGGSLTEKAVDICNKSPVTLNQQEELCFDSNIFTIKKITAIPVVDEDRKVIKIIFADHNVMTADHKNVLNTVPVVIMAGGEGTRLYPFTKILPKPLIPIGEKPISVHIIEKFCAYGANHFIFSINYKANMIKAYFSDIERNYSVDYIQEDKPLGTGGSLYLLKNKLQSTFIVVNCDILLNVDYSKAMEYHKENNNKITVIAAIKDYQIPYGVLKLDEETGHLAQINEKPVFHFTVNTGMYILEPDVLELIPENELYHITHLIERLIKQNQKVGVFPVHGDSWLDMGQLEEMKEMMRKLGIE